MMRKTSLILLGAAAGAALTLITTQPRIVFDGSSAKAAAADTYRQLSLFGDVFERVRADYVEKPDDSKLIESAINGMLAGLEDSYYVDPKSLKLSQPCTASSSRWVMTSFAMMPALEAGVSSIGDTTLTTPFSIVTSMPSPPNSPRVWTCMSL